MLAWILLANGGYFADRPEEGKKQAAGSEGSQYYVVRRSSGTGELNQKYVIGHVPSLVVIIEAGVSVYGGLSEGVVANLAIAGRSREEKAAN